MRSLLFLVYWLCFVSVVKARLNRCSNRDKSALLSVIGDFSYPPVFAESFKGNDPCQDWYGVECLKGRVRAIAFIGMNLTGSISPRFADLTSLSVIDLSHNLLVAPFPRFIGIVVVGLLLIGGGCIAFYLFVRMRRSNRQSESNEGLPHTQESSELNEIVESDNKAIPMQILRDATDDFRDSNIVGRGGFGEVYKGKLLDGIEVAVKRMSQSFIRGKGIDEFRSEVTVLTRVHHRNLVVLHGYCLEGQERLLVYQYMRQGTLNRHLFDWRKEGLRPLDWSRRLLVALDVARGVEYLHTLARQNQSYIHRDLKPSNVLLGEDMRAKLTGRITTKVDVFSFGVILMNLITGQEAIDETRSEGETHIVIWFRKSFREKDSFANVIDETIEVEEETRKNIEDVAELAIHCCAKEPEQRPDMTNAVTVLGSLIQQWKPAIEIEEDEMGFKTSLGEMVKQWKHDMEASSSGTSLK
ncbi:hypothetical protein EUTSA_v10027392mg [Eutrema salsugineum]|uniref:non-specific serine/threonine protein kinase n=1 Tax=Eutrema salsugineum TaxID=72664 RepID=V4LRZ2_EUTSA|nr:hypothetical protein EUTSA_v10027392mg [Eutrema salsugineum]